MDRFSSELLGVCPFSPRPALPGLGLPAQAQSPQGTAPVAHIPQARPHPKVGAAGAWTGQVSRRGEYGTREGGAGRGSEVSAPPTPLSLRPAE